MTKESLRSKVGTLFSSWSGGIRVHGPNVEAKFPAATNNVESPSMILTWVLDDEQPHEDSTDGLATFGGTELMNGAVLAALWVEEGVGDLVLRQKADSLASTFRSGTQTELTFFPMAESGDYSGDNGYWAKEYRLPYIRSHEP